MYGFHFFYNITISTCIHGSKYTFCSMYFVICLFTPSWFMEKEAAFKAGWNHQLLKCGGGAIAANHGKSWSSPWRRWMHVWHDGWQMGKGRWGNETMNKLLKFPLYWTFMKNCPAVTWNFQMKMSHTYDSEVIFRSNLLCKEQPVRKPMSPVARPKGGVPKNLERSRRLKIWVSNQFDKGTVATKCRKMADSQILYNLHITSMFSTKIVCLIHRFINWSSSGHNMSTCI